MTDKALVKRAKEVYGARMFDEWSLNSLVLVREPGVFVYNDLEKEDASQIKYWINKMSLKKTGDTISKEAVAIAKEVDHPLVYLYINKEEPKYAADSILALDVVQRIAPFWFDRFTFFFVEHGPIEQKVFLEKKLDHGITWDKVPALSVVTPKGTAYPIP